MAGELAEAFVKIDSDDAPLKKSLGGIGSMLTTRLGAAGRVAGAAFSSAFTAGVTGGLAALAGIVTGGGFAVKLASDAEELESKLQVTFSGLADTVKAQLDAFGASVGRSRQDLRGMATDLGALLAPMGLGADETAKMSVELAKLASDLASFFNTQDDQALTALRSGILGESEPLRAYGVALSEARIQAELFASGLAKSKDDITPAAKAIAIYNLILKDTKNAQGDAQRTAGSFSNSWRGLTGAIKDAGTTLGQLLLPAMTAISQRARAVISIVERNGEAFRMWGEQIGNIVRNILDALSRVAARMANFFGEQLNQLIQRTTGIAGDNFTDLVTRLLGALETLTADFGRAWEFVKAGAGLAATQVGVAWLTQLNLVKSVAFGVFEGLKRAMLTAFDAMRAAVKVLGLDLTATFAGVENVLNAIIPRFIKLFDMLGASAATAGARIGAAFAASERGKELLDTFREGRESILPEVEAEAGKARSMAASLGESFAGGFKDGFNRGLTGDDLLNSALSALRGKRDEFAGRTGELAGGMGVENRGFGVGTAPEFVGHLDEATRPKEAASPLTDFFSKGAGKFAKRFTDALDPEKIGGKLKDLGLPDLAGKGAGRVADLLERLGPPRDEETTRESRTSSPTVGIAEMAERIQAAIFDGEADKETREREKDRAQREKLHKEVIASLRAVAVAAGGPKIGLTAP